MLILAAFMAGMVGAQAELRKPLLYGAAAAFVASVATWGIAQTVLGSLSRYGEKLEAIVSLVAIGVLLLILNWFYHRVYWGEHLAGLHGKKKRIVGVGVGAATAQLVGLIALGFTSVYREGFETVLFLQAIVLEAGVGIVLIGVAHRARGHARGRLPHDPPSAQAAAQEDARRHRPAHPLGARDHGRDDGADPAGRGLDAGHARRRAAPSVLGGLWFGIFPTWEGLLAQGAALVFVLGSYFAAEQLRARRRRAILDKPLAETTS